MSPLFDPDKPREAVRAVLLDGDRILLARAHDRLDGVHRWWELPGGGIEPEEPIEDALVRELREETGYVDLEVGPARWHWTTEWIFSNRIVHQHDTVHVVTLRSHEQVPTQPQVGEEQDSVHWVPVELLDDLAAPVVPVDLRAMVEEARSTPAPSAPREVAMPARVPWPMVGGAQVMIRLWAVPGRYGELRAAEDQLLRLADEHRGDLVARVRPVALGEDGSGEQPDEVHVLRFPGPLELDAYLGDPRRAAVDLGALLRTEVVPVGHVSTPPT